MPNVLVLTRYDRLGASSRVRFLQFLPELAARNFSFQVRPLLNDAYVKALYGEGPIRIGSVLTAYLGRVRTLLSRGRFDLIWMEKELLPWLPTTIERALLNDTPYVVDFDDAWFHRYDSSPSIWVRAFLGKKIDAVMRNAAAVVAGNGYLAERARQVGARRVETIPSTIDLGRYPETISESSPPVRPIVIGWIGTPVTVHYLEIVEPALRSLSSQRPIELHIVGAPTPVSFSGLPVKSIPWNEADEVARVRAFDIGIMPLDDTPWERGKCAYKLLQVMAAGRPVIASPVGANSIVVEHGVNGFLATTTAEWEAALLVLVDDTALRQRLGLAGHQKVKEHYCIASVLPRLAELLANAARKHSSRAICQAQYPMAI
jgi:glycosyltransferase involved in cell wall biosynthesis